MYLNTFIGGNVCATAKQAQERGGGHSSIPSLCCKVPMLGRLKLSQYHGNLCNLELFHGEEIPYATEITHL
jgi:hypothetical protein